MDDRGHFLLHVDAEQKHEQKQKRNLTAILKDIGRQIVFTAVVMVVGFLAMNYQSYYQITKNYIYETFGIHEENNLGKIVETNKGKEQKLLETGKTLEEQIKKIPDLSMEITPPDMRLIIPRINQNVPVVRVSSEHLIARDWNALEKDIQNELKDGVIHYPGTSFPDVGGNTVITGHSSYFPWDPGRFKDVFALLDKVVMGDKIAMYYNQHKYIYQVTEKKVVLPSNIDVLKQPENQNINHLTLITCTPVGTNLKRLIVIGDLIEKD